MRKSFAIISCLFILMNCISLFGDTIPKHDFSAPVLVGAAHSTSAFHVRTEEGHIEGFSVDVVKSILDESEISYDLFCSSLLREQEHASSLRPVDITLGVVSDVLKDSLYYYSDTLYVGHPQLFVLANTSYKRAVDLKTDALAVSANCMLRPSAHALGFNLLYADVSLDQRVRLLLAQTINAVIVDREEMHAYITNNKLEGRFREIYLDIDPHVHRLGISKNRPDLHAIINKGVLRMKRNGEWARLQYKWLPITGEKYRQYQSLSYLIATLGCLCVLALCYLGYLYIKKQKKISYLEQNDLFETLVDNLPFEMHLNSVRLHEQSNFNMIVVKDDSGEVRHLKKGHIWVPTLDGGTTIHLSYDVTEYINGLNRQAEAERTKSILLANMSHDIRSPLNGVVGFSDLLIQTPIEQTKEIAEYKDIIVSSSQLMLKLFQDILDISHLRSESMTFEPVYTDLCAVMRQVEAHYNKVLEGRDVRFKVYQPYEQMHATLDKDRLLQVVHNIVGNASKYTQRGAISVGLVDGGDYLLFFCWDTGAGISEERQTQVFHRFAKLDEIAKGTGLGMAICKSIANILQGEIDLVSQEKQGSLFWYRIPVLIDSTTNQEFTDWSIIHKVIDQIRTKQYLRYEE